MEPMQAFGDGCEVERSAGSALRFDALEVLSPSGCEAARIPAAADWTRLCRCCLSLPASCLEMTPAGTSRLRRQSCAN
jgi:hypothetical protein